MTHEKLSPPVAAGGARNAQCLSACGSEHNPRDSFLQALADRVDDARRRIEERVRLLDDVSDAVMSLYIEAAESKHDDIDADDAWKVAAAVDNARDELEKTADWLLDLDEELRRIGGAS